MHSGNTVINILRFRGCQITVLLYGLRFISIFFSEAKITDYLLYGIIPLEIKIAFPRLAVQGDYVATNDDYHLHLILKYRIYFEKMQIFGMFSAIFF